MAQELELGQMMHGNPTGDYGTEEYMDALVTELLSEIGRVYWNINQIQWNISDDPLIEGVEFRPYYWGEDEVELDKPNLKFNHSPQEIRWYKHPGRGQSCSVKMSADEWVNWFNGALEIIRASDKTIY